MYTNLSCISDKVGILIPCESQPDIVYWLDDLGLSLADASATADERYLTGKKLVEGKVRIAMNEVVMWLTQNVTRDCTTVIDVTDGILCDEADRIARAVWYKAAALVYKEVAVDSSRYNEFIQFGRDTAMAQMIWLDSSFKVLTNLEDVPAGMYQKELDMLLPTRALVERECTPECRGSRWQITIP